MRHLSTSDDRIKEQKVTLFFPAVSRRPLVSCQICNQRARSYVISVSVDALWITWLMILMQHGWLKLRFGTTIKLLRNWSVVFIHWWRNWCAHTGHAALPRKIFAR